MLLILLQSFIFQINKENIILYFFKNYALPIIVENRNSSAAPNKILLRRPQNTGTLGNVFKMQK